MNKRQRNNTILVIIIILLASLIGAFYLGSKKPQTPKPEETQTIDIIKYSVYDYKKVDFRFIIAEISVESDKDLNIPLDEIYVDGISLDKKTKYIQLLRDNDYEDDFTNVDDSFVLSAKETITLFIPVVNKDATIAKLTSKHFDDIEFDLSKNIVVSNEVDDEEEPGVEEPVEEIPDDTESNPGEEQIIEETGFKVILEPSYSNRDYVYYVDGIQYQSASSEVLHVFPVKLISKDNKTYEITDAKFVFNEGGSEIQAESPSYKTVYEESILNQKTENTKEGAIMFITYSQSLESITYQGKLFIKINNSEWFELEVKI